MNLILIDRSLPDLDILRNSIGYSNVHVMYDVGTDTYGSLLEKINDKLLTGSILGSICLLNHKRPVRPFVLLEREQDVSDWISFLEQLRRYKYEAIDMVACQLLLDEEWNALISRMEEELNIRVRASKNKTGNNPGDDWIMEEGLDIRDLYFNDRINTYLHSFSDLKLTADNIVIKESLTLDDSVDIKWTSSNVMISASTSESRIDISGNLNVIGDLIVSGTITSGSTNVSHSNVSHSNSGYEMYLDGESLPTTSSIRYSTDSHVYHSYVDYDGWELVMSTFGQAGSSSVFLDITLPMGTQMYIPNIDKRLYMGGKK